MRIAFIVGSFAPGKSGVGDYTRILAAACAARGHQTCVIALADLDAAAVLHETQAGVACLRLPSHLPAHNRRAAAEKKLAEFAPDIVSLQFVTYSFNNRGVVYDLEALLPRVRVPMQVMMHELWIGAEVGASLFDRLLGRVQRHFVAKLLARRAPKLVHTSTAAYVARLAQAKISANVLPMINTIPIVDAADSAAPDASPDAAPDFAIDRAFANAGVADFSARRAQGWTFVLFGAIYPAWQPESLFAQIESAAARAKKVLIVSLGNQGGGQAHFARIATKYRGRFDFAALGERTAAEISQFFRVADFGLSTSPWLLVGKSAATAAMVAHGLPVLVSRDDVHYAGLTIASSPHAQLYRMSDAPDLATLSRAQPRDTAPVIDQFLADLARVLA